MNIYEFAMRMEQDGEAFYRDLASKSNQPGVKRILTMLADDEVKHYHTVKKMAENAAPTMAGTTILADAKNVFAGMQGTSLDLKGAQSDVYRQAQEIERQSQTFYEEKASEVTDPDAQALLLKIADEEKRHYFLLDHVIEFLDRPRTWIENAEFNHLEDY
ncbi:MAG: ferritin family protein [Anaerolineae bacterium]|nr:ferritin family protein [Anaerolineae bacterium]